MKKTIQKKVGLPLIVILSVILLGGCSEVEEFSDSSLLMDTRVDILVTSESKQEADRAIDAVKSEIQRLENKLSRHEQGSEVDKINDKAGEKPVAVSDETWEVITGAIEIGERMDGKFDITIAPILEAYGFGKDEQKVPNEDELEELLQLVDHNNIELNEQEQTVYLPDSNMKIDLGGVAKGFILDRSVEVLEEYNIYSGLVDGGGDISTTSKKFDDTPWVVGVSHPRKNDHFAEIELQGESIVTSGDYERYFMENDTRYHHIIDPDTGKPSHDVISVTVISDYNFKANIKATGAFNLGLEASLDLFEKEEDLEAVIIDGEGEYHITSGFDETLIRENYQDTNFK
ncbi:FAD:protein FMN transferase [Natranaerobius trueperi]|uniref:FAD:protein FMN transferase n=1 Tax=Natranaerobius trueperi TaxID=759412 RepID=A0A226BYR1_9FIRM|nr:FAD:protein FMN transferase [Natranaerobius trueperi]OWZ83912.1 hypothetical protein CDO51_05865 [Natranaerobius trueperi]